MQIILDGIVAGSAIALLALAFQVVLLPTRVFFMGLSGLFVFAPYLFNAAHGVVPSVLLGVVVAVFGVVALATMCECLNHGPLDRRGAGDGGHLISSMGIGILLVQIIVMIWGNGTQSLVVRSRASISLGCVVITGPQVIMGLVSIVLCLAILVILKNTKLGLHIRALADDPIRFATLGFDVNRYRMVSFAISGGLAAGAALLTAQDVGFDPSVGLRAVLLAVVAVIVGGRRSFAGPLVGGLLLGVLRALTVWYLSARWQDVVTFCVLVFFLLIRPSGLFGRPTRLEAA